MSAIPTTQKQWTITPNPAGVAALTLVDGTVPELGPHDVLVNIKAASLNNKDNIVRLPTPFSPTVPTVPLSDGAGVVVATGAKVTRFAKGDRVSSLFSPLAYTVGRYPEAGPSLGAQLDGTARPYGAFDEQSLVRIPDHLSFEEAATLPCAGVTAYNGLYGVKDRAVRAGDWVLVEGTGGVSIFVLQLAKAAGATVVATTSSDAKAAKLKALGADHVVNYKTDADWGVSARALTPGGVGFDHIVDIGGHSTLPHAIKASRFGATITVVGKSDYSPDAPREPDITTAIYFQTTFRGVQVGNREHFEGLVASIEGTKWTPVVDKVFEFKDLEEAYKYLVGGTAFGKVVVKVD